ncbi:hypothetical protein IFU11_16895 [Plantibacter sp. CFBP 8804]|nr:hypothetical protein [Plantibacter sp. CFBP 8804]
MADSDLFTPTEVEAPTARGRRGKILAVSIALAGILLVSGTGVSFAIQAGHTALDNLSTGESAEYVPLAEREDIDTSQLVNPTPTVTSVDGIRRNEFGTPLYDVNSDRSLITVPDSVDEYRKQQFPVWIDQQFIIAKCMADLGFDYVFVLDWERTPSDRENGKQNEGPHVDTPEWEALQGTWVESGGEYRWEDAGCNGYAVHLTGMDGQN